MQPPARVTRQVVYRFRRVLVALIPGHFSGFVPGESSRMPFSPRPARSLHFPSIGQADKQEAPKLDHQGSDGSP